MMASKVKRGLLCVGILVVVQLESAMAYEFFTSKCGETIDISTDHSEVLDSQLSFSYAANEDCTVTITTALLQKVLVTFRSVDIEGSGLSCSGDYLEIYDGLFGNLIVNTLATICGSSTPLAVASTLNSITLTFRSDSSINRKGFEIVVTSFSTGYCGSDDFKCNNGRCIDKSLKNNLEDNCGDPSDENWEDLLNGVNDVIGWGIGLIVGVIVGCIVGVILLCVCCGCLCYHLCCKSKAPARSTTTTVAVPQGGHMQPGAYSQQPGAPPPAYNQPPMAMQQTPGQYGQQQAPYDVKT